MAANFKTYDLVGRKEDVSDIISRISPEETPFTKQIGRETVDNTLFQWLEDSLAPVNLNNARVEGHDFVDQELTATRMRQNHTQILDKVINVSETSDRVKKYGRAKELAYQFEKKAAEAKIDLEAIMLSGQVADAGSSATPRKMASVQAQIDADNRYATGSATTSPTVTLLKKVQHDGRINGARYTDILMHVSEADVPGTWYQQTSTSNVRQVPVTGAGASTVTDYVDVFVGPTGKLSVELSLWITPTDYLVYAPKNFDLCTLRPWTTEALAKTSDSTRMALVGEYSLKHKNFKASAVIRKTTGTNGKF